ncbi:MAG: oxidoreductase [Ignavibacteriae bacterium]|nr:MAG: oxidoreductase [Ignavibacteriota bacterium]
MSKPKLALYWASSCGGCEIAVVDLEAKILDVAGFFEIVLWPCVMDFKYKDIEALPDGDITLCLFNGAIRTSENEHLAKMLRAKSKVMVAFGSCAGDGAIPSLANFYDKDSIYEYVFKTCPSLEESSRGVYPETKTTMPEGEIEIPVFWETVKTLDQVIDVDYYIPGCPPQTFQIAAAVEAVIDILQNGKPLPPKGTVLGAGDKTCCDDCTRVKSEKKIKKFYRPQDIITDPEQCLLEQGIVCMGPATRNGCEALCMKANMGCRGCYGPPEGVLDQGAKMVSALSSVIDAQNPEDAKKIIDTIADPLGTFYRFSMASSILRRVQKKNNK